MKNLLTGLLLLASTTVPAQQETIIRIHPEQGTTVIDKNIYGQSQCFEGLESAYSSLAGRLLCR